MEEFKGTPGPWFQSKGVVYSQESGQTLNGDYSTEVCNATLMAAAPELMEALQETIHEVGCWLSTQKPELKEKIEAAIKKALGEKQ